MRGTKQEDSQGIIVQHLQARILESLLVCGKVVTAELNDDLQRKNGGLETNKIRSN
jgi:hypothetical protein